jgi:3-methyladenine DNA glycosylase AlkD
MRAWSRRVLDDRQSGLWDGVRVSSRSFAKDIDAELRVRAVPERAAHEKAYLKSDLEHYGTPVPVIRAIAKRFHEHHSGLDHEAVLALVRTLWDEPVHERRMVAIELLEVYGERVRAADMEVLERLLRESRTWALVDGLAASVVGPLVERDLEAASVLDRWAADEDFWIRRAALLAHLLALRRGEGNFERFGRYADKMLDEKEFFVRKAIGWVLRDTARKRPTMVHDWLVTRAPRASGVTLREAIKPMTEAQRQSVLAAR